MPPRPKGNTPSPLPWAGAQATSTSTPSPLTFHPDPNPSAGYPNDEYFDLLHVVTPAFNRAVIYSAKQLHNAYIDDRAVGQLSCAPKQGRLTANVFLK